jgi:putative membrane protein
MNERACRAMTAGGFALALVVAPLSGLVAQVVGNTPGSTTSPTTRPAPTTPTPTTPTTPTTTVNQSSQGDVQADAAFLRDAASANMMEIRLGQTAQTKAMNSAVKQFGQRMVNDHTNLQNQVASLVTANKVSVSQAMSSKNQDEFNRVNKLSGQAFDSAYMNLMVQAHQQDIAKFQTQSRSAKSEQVRTLATNSLPVLQQHLSLATQVANQVGITTNVVTDTSTTTTTAGGNQPNRNVRSDMEFIRDAGAGNAMFVQLSEIAQNKAKDNAVKQFAERARSDFEKLDDQWSNMASNNNVKTGGMGKRHHEKIERLQKASGGNFDKTYMTIMVQQLHDRLSYWQNEGRSAKSARVRNLVDNGLPTVQQLYAQAQQVSRQIGVNPDAALRNRTDIATEKENNKNKNKNK